MILQRSLTLATQATDGTLNGDQLKSIGAELVALKSEVDNIFYRTQFQGGGADLVFDMTLGVIIAASFIVFYIVFVD